LADGGDFTNCVAKRGPPCIFNKDIIGQFKYKSRENALAGNCYTTFTLKNDLVQKHTELYPNKKMPSESTLDRCLHAIAPEMIKNFGNKNDTKVRALVEHLNAS
jgi:hypothetical protein